jgi:hypothetical protein
LGKGWAEAFPRHIFPKTSKDRLAVPCSDNPALRSEKPVDAIAGMLILRELNNDTENPMLEFVIIDVRCQYALHTTNFAEQPDSDRTNGYDEERDGIPGRCIGNTAGHQRPDER